MLNERIHSSQWFNTLIPPWLTVGRVAYIVVRLVMRGLSTRYPTVDSMVDTGCTSASVI